MNGDDGCGGVVILIFFTSLRLQTAKEETSSMEMVFLRYVGVYYLACAVRCSLCVSMGDYQAA